MKKILVVLIIGLGFLGCSTQNVDAQSSNDAQRIIGTWENNIGSTWVFSTNGTISISRNEYKFVVTNNNKLVIMDGGTAIIYNISITSDGRFILLEVAFRTAGGSRVFNDFGNCFLTKQ